jgi:hypothetical protein
MWFVTVDGYGVPIGTIFWWLVIDFPVSWAIMIFSEFVFDVVGRTNTVFLIAGGLQWGLWGWLFGNFVILMTRSPPQLRSDSPNRP